MRSRRAEPLIADIATDRRRYVGLRVTAAYLEIDVRTLKKYLASNLLKSVAFDGRKRIELKEIRAFEERQRSGREG